MFKKSLIMLTLAFVMMPMLAQAYNLTTRINKVGAPVNGQLQVNALPVQTSGSVLKTIANGTNVNIVIAPAAGYVISKIQQGSTYLAVTPTGQTVNIPATNTASQTVNVWFDQTLVSVTAFAGIGGTVSPAGTQNLRQGTAKSYIFTPSTGKNVVSIGGLPSGATVTPAVPAAVNTPVTVAITVPATTVTMTGVFQSVIADAGSPQIILTGGAATLDASASAGTGLTYAWLQTSGAAVSLSSATAQKPTFTAPAGTYSFQVTVTDGVTSSVATTSVTVTDSLAAAVRAACADCHIPQGIGGVAGANVFYNWSSSNKFNSPAVACVYCHKDADTGGHPGTTGDNCVGCHNITAPKHGNGVADNNGVRAITTEFGKWSHHVTGVTLNNAHCAACHLEGKASNGAIVVDPAYHMADNQTHLRNSDTDGDFAWNPAAPNHTNMDNFCMSCHDANGATSQGSVDIQAVINAIPAGAGRNGTAGALNPFGDTISNQYDQVLRGAVVAVKEQFDIGNSSHHAVRGARYTSNTLNQSQINDIIAANVANGETGTAIIAGGTGTQPATATELATVGTLYQTAKFITLYQPLVNGVGTPAAGTVAALGDNSTLHCADCHTVGQYKPGSTTNADGSLTTVVIGAHGSQNEYMLRNSNGSDSTTAATSDTTPVMVCYICHAVAQYGTPNTGSVAANSHDSAISHTSGNDCNGGGNNNMGLVGGARFDRDLLNTLNTNVGGTHVGQSQLTSGTLGGGGAGNIFGNKCSNCHNSSDNKNFGGIHGNAFRQGVTTTITMNATYKAYSGANGATVAAPQALSAVDRKPYRFLPGLGNFRYNGGADSNAWTRKAIGSAGKSERMGCYTLNGTSSKRVVGANPSGTGGYGVDYIPNVSPTNAAAAGANVSSNGVASDNGILGSWGACTDHTGTSTGAAGHSVSRTSIRPLTY